MLILVSMVYPGSSPPPPPQHFLDIMSRLQDRNQNIMNRLKDKRQDIMNRLKDKSQDIMNKGGMGKKLDHEPKPGSNRILQDMLIEMRKKERRNKAWESIVRVL